MIAEARHAAPVRGRRALRLRLRRGVRPPRPVSGAARRPAPCGR